MNRKLQAVLWLGTSILVLAAMILTAQGTLAAPQAQIVPGAFTKATASNPVVNKGAAASWDEGGVYSPSVLWYSSTYQMWYTGVDALYTSSAIGYATSTNGTSWIKYGSNPVLTKGTAGTWEGGGVSFACVVPDGGGFKMWYTGSGQGKRRIGYATSSDGTTWARNTNPVLDVGTTGWDAVQVSNPTVTKVGSTYHMWYSSVITPAGGIGHATSTNGTDWTKDGGNPVIPGGSGGWDDTVFAPFVLYDGSMYQMWYTGCNAAGEACQIGYARSTNGSTWYKRGVVLTFGSAGAFDSGLVGYPSVMLGVPYYRMWYTGAGSDEIFRIGLAMAFRLDKENFVPVIKK